MRGKWGAGDQKVNFKGGRSLTSKCRGGFQSVINEYASKRYAVLPQICFFFIFGLKITQTQFEGKTGAHISNEIFLIGVTKCNFFKCFEVAGGTLGITK